MQADGVRDDLLCGAAAVVRAGLVTAFGHLSARGADGVVLITPGIPLDEVRTAGQLRSLSLEENPDLSGLPGEAWIHWALYRANPLLGGICRAQPPGADLASATGVEVIPRHGQGSFLGAAVAHLDAPRLIRARSNAEPLARPLAAGSAIIMRGNGAVTVGADLGAAVARMWVLERSAQLNVAAAGRQGRPALSLAERHPGEAVQDELLGRIWAHLRRDPDPPISSATRP